MVHNINDNMDGDLIARIIVASLLIAFLVFLFIGIPAIVWFYVINLINITMSEKILIFIFFYLIYLIVL